MKDIIKLSRTYYKKLVCLVKDINKISNDIGKPLNSEDLEHLCSILNGHNLSDELFDCNYGSICATIILENGKFALSPSVEIWDDNNCEMLDANYMFEEE